MLRVLNGLRKGEAPRALIDYLMGIEVDHMGVRRSNARSRARATVAAIEQRLVGSSLETTTVEFRAAVEERSE